jgi:hypothetical protein
MAFWETPEELFNVGLKNKKQSRDREGAAKQRQ